ncbi:tRNA pseudouridine synthase-like 1, partial [Glandiceps talaboti]
SSRTDAGVHAICNTAHTDIIRPSQKEPFTEDIVQKGINKLLKNYEIRINKVKIVPEDFHARFNANGRTYVYRLAVGVHNVNNVSLFDRNRCWPIRQRLDLEKMQKAAEVLIGRHDFTAFRGSSKENATTDPVRTMDNIEICQSQGILQHLTTSAIDCDVEYYDIKYQARSFIYKQVRKLTTALVGVGSSIITTDDIKAALKQKNGQILSRLILAPPGGLYLQEVSYDPKDFEMEQIEDTNSTITNHTINTEK